MKLIQSLLVLGLLAPTAWAADNQLAEAERKEGWILLFDGRTLDGWMTSNEKPSLRPVEEHCINPHRCGGYMMVHTRPWANFVLQLDFKISPGCNSGIFFRTWPLKPQMGKDVGYNGLEMAIDDTQDVGYHDTGAIYDLVKSARNAMKPAGQWNHVEIACNKSRIRIELNGERVTAMDLDQWADTSQRPNGTRHKFSVAWKDHSIKGYIGLQDHGKDCWFKNIKLKPLPD